MNCPNCKTEYNEDKRLVKRCKNVNCEIYSVSIHFSDVTLFDAALARAEQRGFDAAKQRALEIVSTHSINMYSAGVVAAKVRDMQPKSAGATSKCDCNLPGFDVGNSAVCPTCKKTHRTINLGPAQPQKGEQG